MIKLNSKNCLRIKIVHGVIASVFDVIIPSTAQLWVTFICFHLDDVLLI